MPALPAHGSADLSTAQRLHQRQVTVAIPALYQNQNSSPAPGAVVGIVLGSVAAFIFLIWLFSTLTGMSMVPEVEEEVVVSSSRRARSPTRSRRSHRSEMTTTRHQDRIVRQERIVRDTSRAPPAQGYIVTEETQTRGPLGENTVEVVEEGGSSIITDVRRDRSRRRSSRSRAY